LVFVLLAIVIIVVIVLIALVSYLVFSVGTQLGIQMASFIYPTVPAMYAVKIILYLRWERKHNRIILYDGLPSTRVYTAPRTKIQQSERMYCIYCGTENRVDAVFCRECGKRIKYNKMRLL
jgi:hypothetical protein